MIHVETIGANGMPPTVMVFQVTVDGDQLTGLLTSAGSMPPGERSVPTHLKEALTVLLATSTAGAHPSQGTAGPGASSDGGAAPTPPAQKSSKAKTLHRIAVEDDADAVNS